MALGTATGWHASRMSPSVRWQWRSSSRTVANCAPPREIARVPAEISPEMVSETSPRGDMPILCNVERSYRRICIRGAARTSRSSARTIARPRGSTAITSSGGSRYRHPSIAIDVCSIVILKTGFRIVVACSRHAGATPTERPGDTRAQCNAAARTGMPRLSLSCTICPRVFVSLFHLKYVTWRGQIRSTAIAVVIFDPKWPGDIQALNKYEGIAEWHEVVQIDKFEYKMCCNKAHEISPEWVCSVGARGAAGRRLAGRGAGKMKRPAQSPCARARGNFHALGLRINNTDVLRAATLNASDGVVSARLRASAPRGRGRRRGRAGLVRSSTPS